MNSKARKRLGDLWFSLAFKLKLGTQRKWALKETYEALGLRTTTWYDTPFVHLGLLSPQFNTPQVFVEAVECGIDGLDYNVPGDGTYLDDTARQNRERAVSRTPRSVRDDFFKGLCWPRETRSGTPLASSTPASKRSRGGDNEDEDAGTKRSRDDTSYDDDPGDDEVSDDFDDDSDSDDDDDSDSDDDDDGGGEGSNNGGEEEFDLPLPAKRRGYSAEERQAILALLEKVNGDKTRAIRIVNKKSGYEKVRRAHLDRWSISKAKKRLGRPVNVDYERAVVGHLLYTVLDTVDGVEQASVVANVAHSYEIVKLAAETTRKKEPWATDAKIMKLKFSNKWVKGFLRRLTLRRRRNTSNDKVLPLPHVVAARMKEIQAVIELGPAGGQPVGDSQTYDLDDIVNADETASRYALKPLNQYVPEGAARGASPDFDESARFTSMLGGTPTGKMLPIFNIIKCTINRPDLSTSTVINKLHQQPGYTHTDGWTLGVWSRVLVLKAKGGAETEKTYVRPYILHADGTVITTQHKAWMDSVGMCMWVDLLIGPWARASGRKKILVWDSCGPHKVAAVKRVFEFWGIAIEALPVNMTDVLQVMDLVVNGPLKAHMRRFRCLALFNYFQEWKLKWGQELQKPEGTRVMPPFTPPKPALIDGLNMLKSVSKDVFSSPGFKAGLVRAFVKVGLVKEEESGKFVEYTTHSRGNMLLALTPPDSVKKEQFKLEDVVVVEDDFDVDGPGDETDGNPDGDSDGDSNGDSDGENR